MKSNLNTTNAIKILEKWQLQTDVKKLIYVVSFNLSPQSDKGKFCLSVDFYIAGYSQSVYDTKTEYFYGSIVECVNQAVDKLNEMKDEMRKRL